MGEDRGGICFCNGIHIFFDGVIPDQHGSTDLFCRQKHGEKLGNTAQENRNLVAFTEAKSLQRLGDAFGSAENLSPSDLRSVVVNGWHIQAGHICLQILGERALGNLQIIQQFLRVVFQPGLVHTGFSSHGECHIHVG